MTAKMEGTIATIVALFVLFSAMLSPWVSVIVSVTALLALAIYRFWWKEQ